MSFAGCNGKIPYKSSRDAMKAAVAAARRDRERENNKAFPCAECGLWHIGRSPRNGPQKRKLRRLK